MDQQEPKPPALLKILMVSSLDSLEFSHFQSSLRLASVVALDAEWKPARSQQIADKSEESGVEPIFPKVTLLQIACRVCRGASDSEAFAVGNSPVFLVDLLAIPLSAIWELLRDMLISPSVLKLGFRFKQDLVYLSSTFSSQGFLPGFDKVEPFIDITSIYYHMKYANRVNKFPKDAISLASICWEILSVPLSKELQCSDWSHRPLTEGQMLYAAADAYYLLEIFSVFEQKFLTEVQESSMPTESSFSKPTGLNEIFTDSRTCKKIAKIKFCSASDMIKPSYPLYISNNAAMGSVPQTSCKSTNPPDEHISDIVEKYGEKILLKESDRQPRVSRRKRERRSFVNTKRKGLLEMNEDWQGPPPWDAAFGGDGRSRFLCDVMVEGLARHLRCVGIDAAVPSFKKPDPR